VSYCSDSPLCIIATATYSDIEPPSRSASSTSRSRNAPYLLASCYTFCLNPRQSSRGLCRVQVVIIDPGVGKSGTIYTGMCKTVQGLLNRNRYPRVGAYCRYQSLRPIHLLCPKLRGCVKTAQSPLTSDYSPTPRDRASYHEDNSPQLPVPLHFASSDKWALGYAVM